MRHKEVGGGRGCGGEGRSSGSSLHVTAGFLSPARADAQMRGGGGGGGGGGV